MDVQTLFTKEMITSAMLSAFKEVQESSEATEEVLLSSRPGGDFEYIDSQILLVVTGLVAAELDVQIPKKCQLFLGPKREQLTVEQAAEKLLNLIEQNGTRQQ